MSNKKGNTMSKFSKFYHEKTVDICKGDSLLFQVTVTEISTKSKEDIQREGFREVDRNVKGYGKKQAQRIIQERIAKATDKIDAVETTVRMTVLPGIKSWTLTDDDGNPAAINYETWQELPEFITEQIEKAVEELNPESDDEFPDGSGNAD
jgi:hypothetical protein